MSSCPYRCWRGRHSRSESNASCSQRPPFLADPYSQVYDVSPDGRFVMIRGAFAGGVPEELIVVENFFEELKAKVKRSRD